MNFLKTAILFLILCFGAGCAVTDITSEPPGADVWLNTRYLGQTPMKYKVKQEIGHMNKYKFTAILEGYQRQSKTYYESPTMNVIDVIPSKIHFKLLPLETNGKIEEGRESPDNNAEN